MAGVCKIYVCVLLCTTTHGLGQSIRRAPDVDSPNSWKLVTNRNRHSIGSQEPKPHSFRFFIFILAGFPLLSILSSSLVPSNNNAHRTLDIRHSSPPPPTSPIQLLPLKPRLTRRRLRPPLQVRVRVANRASNSVESEPRTPGRELHFGADVKEGEIPVYEVVRDAGCFVLLTGKRRTTVSEERRHCEPETDWGNGDLRRRRSGRRGRILLLRKRSGPIVWGPLRLCRSLRSRRLGRRFWCGSSGSLR
jgi:hypothetical protein